MFIEIDNHYQYNEINKYLFEGDSDELWCLYAALAKCLCSNEAY